LRESANGIKLGRARLSRRVCPQIFIRSRQFLRPSRRAVFNACTRRILVSVNLSQHPARVRATCTQRNKDTKTPSIKLSRKFARARDTAPPRRECGIDRSKGGNGPDASCSLTRPVRVARLSSLPRRHQPRALTRTSTRTSASSAPDPILWIWSWRAASRANFREIPETTD